MIDWDEHVLKPTADVFGESVTYTPVAGAPLTIIGVYDEGYKQDVVLEDGVVGVTTTKPLLGVRLAEFATPPAQNDQVFIPRINTTFIVSDVDADSHGWAKLKLNRVTL
ncbi:MAG: hypothetical protein EPN62_08770 [Candidimonas sp.]|nr:MAG: hypothetical protein EPN77_06005 [Candidimonas sp.]TAM23759.1 MAG: hypothetical protein EPN62_08770 [Candidimonas sp.]